jgi:hypothetical protein
MGYKLLTLVFLSFFISLSSLGSREKEQVKTSKQLIEKNPRNKAFVESFQAIYSFGVVEKQEERKKEEKDIQKASP